jgi:hypothetical protein
MKTTRMIIGEAVSDEFLKDIVTEMQQHVIQVQGLLGHSILVEDGGRMVILITDWLNRAGCVTYHCSKACRQLTASTQHMLLGNYVVKMFQNVTA